MCIHVCVLNHFSHIQLFATMRTVACHAPLSVRFPRQENWSGLPCPPPGALSDPGIEPAPPASPSLQADSLPLSHWRSPELNTVLSNTSPNLVYFRWFSLKVELIMIQDHLFDFSFMSPQKVAIFSSYLFCTFTLKMISIYLFRSLRNCFITFSCQHHFYIGKVSIFTSYIF